MIAIINRWCLYSCLVGDLRFLQARCYARGERGDWIPINAAPETERKPREKRVACVGRGAFDGSNSRFVAPWAKRERHKAQFGDEANELQRKTCLRDRSSDTNAPILMIVISRPRLSDEEALRDRASDQIHSCSTRTSSPFFSRASVLRARARIQITRSFSCFFLCELLVIFAWDTCARIGMENPDDKEKTNGRSSAVKNGSNYVTRDARASNSSGARSYARRLLARVSPYARSRAHAQNIANSMRITCVRAYMRILSYVYRHVVERWHMLADKRGGSSRRG